MHVPANTTVSFSMQQIEDQILYYVQYFSLLNFLYYTGPAPLVRPVRPWPYRFSRGGNEKGCNWDSNLATRLTRAYWRFKLDVHDVYVPDQAFQPTHISFPPRNGATQCTRVV